MQTIVPPSPGKGLLLVLRPPWLQDIRKEVLVWLEGPFVPWLHLLHQLLEHLLPYFYIVFFHHGCSAVPMLGQGLLSGGAGAPEWGRGS